MSATSLGVPLAVSLAIIAERIALAGHPPPSRSGDTVRPDRVRRKEGVVLDVFLIVLTDVVGPRHMVIGVRTSGWLTKNLANHAHRRQGIAVAFFVWSSFITRVPGGPIARPHDGPLFQHIAAI